MPFVGLELPFVGLAQPRIRPFIYINRPSVKIPRSSGFSLVELIVTVAIAGVLMAVALPSLSNFVKDNRLTTQANEMMVDLAFARSEALKRAANITVCKSTDGATCNAGANWSDGWIVVNTAGGQVFRVHEALTDQITLVGTANAAPGLSNQIFYTRTGISGLGGPEEFRICDDRGPAQGRWIEVALTGRARIAIDANSSRPTPPPACSP